jgi:uncharacterized protein YkwD
VTTSLLGIAFAASLSNPQVLPLTSGSSVTQHQPSARTVATMQVANRAQDVDAMLAALNARRASKGLAALVLDPALCSVAYDHAADMVVRSYFDHYTPEGLSPFARMEKAHIPFGYAGENMALDQNSRSAELALWESREHRDNILGAHYAKVGIAAVAGTQGEIFVEDFSD